MDQKKLRIDLLVDQLNIALDAQDFVTFVRLLRGEVEAQGGIDVVSKRVNLEPHELELILADEDRPKYANVHVLLRALKLHFTVDDMRKSTTSTHEL